MESYSRYNPHKDFTTLEAWKKARELKLFLYLEVIPMLPTEEKFNLNVQIRKLASQELPTSLKVTGDIITRTLFVFILYPVDQFMNPKTTPDVMPRSSLHFAASS